MYHLRKEEMLKDKCQVVTLDNLDQSTSLWYYKNCSQVRINESSMH